MSAFFSKMRQTIISKLQLRKSTVYILCSFVVASLLVINSFLQRKAVINRMKNEINYTIKILNDMGWDLAYEHISFSILYPKKLVYIKAPKFYNVKCGFSFETDEISLNSGLFSSGKIGIDLGENQKLVLNGKSHNVNAEFLDLTVELLPDNIINNFVAQISNLKIADIADIEEGNFAARLVAPQHINAKAPFFKGYFDVKNIKLNGLLDYPLGQNIERIFANIEIIGRVNRKESLQETMHSWLANDGFIDIKDFNISWMPLRLVGKGSLYFNEKYKPILQMNTSSKALLNLIDELEEKRWLDSKGVFVAKILLNNKAYKADNDDKYLTLTTPISIQDDALLIEKIVVKKF